MHPQIPRVRSLVLLGGALPFVFAGVSDCNTVSVSPVLDVSAAEVAATMSTVPACTVWDDVGGVDTTVSGECHTQGISRFFGQTVLSCQDDDADQGILNFLARPLADYAWPGPGTEPLTLAPPELRGDLDHAAVGQALPRADGQVLLPVVSSASADTPARVDLYDGNASVVCSFDHTPAHLGAAALFAVSDVVYLAACSWDCDQVYVYELDPALADCGPVQLSASPVADDANLRTPIPGSSDENWAPYNSLAVFQIESQSLFDVYLLAGHDGWLDTWQVVGATGPGPRFEKVAKAEWGENQADHGDKGMLYEGMTLERVDADSIDLFTAPHDFGSCDGGRECVRAVYQCRMDF